MKLSDLLIDEWVAVPLRARDLGEALHELLTLASRHGALSAEHALTMADELAEGGRGEIMRVNEDVVLVQTTLDSLSGPSVTLGLARTPFSVEEGRRTPPGSARAVVLLMAPRKDAGLRAQIAPTIARALRERGRTERLLSAESVAEIRGMRELMETHFESRLLVEDAIEPVRYRVYPETPVAEVLGLMVRRTVRAVPVVGERYEVLGIITSGDALRYLLRRPRSGPEKASEPTVTARDVMTRTVLCVAEDQTLAEAAHMMVSREVDQLPVVREGELVGFVTRDSILEAILGGSDRESDEQDEESSS